MGVKWIDTAYSQLSAETRAQLSLEISRKPFFLYPAHMQQSVPPPLKNSLAFSCRSSHSHSIISVSLSLCLSVSLSLCLSVSLGVEIGAPG